MEELMEKLKDGGVESVPVDGIEECGDERCADIKGACGDKVGTCWVEARCGGGGGGRSPEDQVDVKPRHSLGIVVPIISRDHFGRDTILVKY